MSEMSRVVATVELVQCDGPPRFGEEASRHYHGVVETCGSEAVFPRDRVNRGETPPGWLRVVFGRVEPVDLCPVCLRLLALPLARAL